ncbi:FecR family protein [Bacteroides sp.]|uniref:FecR family protein n=1 Tax=Bacteroides sp. TaxID=29523 RepID=UPI0025BA91F2|nr:FecR domain-containing protein [Bacteroides sp.]
MKYTDRELEEILNKLIASTRSPRGRFSAVAGYPELEKKLKSHTRRLTLIRTFSAAAAVLLLCLSTWTVYLYMQPVSIETVSTLAETRTVHLPDGSTVTLNHYSSISYPEKFKSGNREVELNGEAYFEVSKDKKHPFIVQTEMIDVQVLGTHFNVDAYLDNPDVRTTLLTGSVAVSNKNNSVRMVLKPNEIAIYNKVEQKLTRKALENAKDEISWRHGEFIFDDLPLQEIVRELSNSFGTSIRISDTALQDYRITARFRNGEDLKTILSVLHNAGYFDYSQNDKQIIITAKPDFK